MFTLTLVVAAVFLPAGLHAFNFERQPDDDMLDKWLAEEMTGPAIQGANPSNARGAENMGYATPGHVVNEQDFMNAFFNNQDHDAFAGEAEDETYGGEQGDVENYIADFFGNNPDSASTQNNVVREDIPDINTVNEAGMDEFLGDFFEGQAPQTGNKDAAAQWTFDPVPRPVVNEDYTNNGAGLEAAGELFNYNPDPTYSQGGPYDGMPGAAMNEEYGNNGVDADAESYIGDFFNTEPDTTSQRGPNYAVFAEIEDEDGNQQEENEAAGPLLKPNFNHIPPNDLFAFASIQEHQDPVCKRWKQGMVAAQTVVNNLGKRLQEVLKKLSDVIEKYKEQQKEKCDLHCQLVCVPGDVGEECVEKDANGTCIVMEPKIDDCASRIPNPKCNSDEADCKSRKGPLAKAVEKAKMVVDEVDKKLEEASAKLEKHAESFPPKCQKIPEPPKEPAPPTPPKK